jgi:MFS family permease
MTTDRGPARQPLWRAFAHRNFRLFFAGQTVSLIGTWMQQVALTWLVWDVTRSPFWLGLVGFASQIPSFFLAPVAGVLVDRVNRHRLLLLTQTLAMLQAFLMAALALQVSEGRQVPDYFLPTILGLGCFLGTVTVFDMTARQAFLTEIIDRREDLGNAIALNSSMVNGTRLVGPALAGLLLAQTGAAVCFLVNGLSYLAVLAALLVMRLQPRPIRRHTAPLVQGLSEGFRYVFGFAPIRVLLLLLALVSLASTFATVLYPVFADKILGGGATTLGYLMAASGLGALASALWLASRQSVLGLGKWIPLASGAFGLALVGFSYSENTWLSLLLLLVAGAGMMVEMAATNTILQTIVEEDKRGRVMSWYALAFLGTVPLGSLLAGGLADRLGAPLTVRVAGLCSTAGALLFAFWLPALREQVRPIYVRIGILSEAAAGVQAASELTLPPRGR